MNCFECDTKCYYRFGHGMCAYWKSPAGAKIKDKNLATAGDLIEALMKFDANVKLRTETSKDILLERSL